jgi:hypothetical protein
VCQITEGNEKPVAGVTPPSWWLTCSRQAYASVQTGLGQFTGLPEPYPASRAPRRIGVTTRPASDSLLIRRWPYWVGHATCKCGLRRPRN